MKTALILGVTGQDGSYLAESLLSRGYKVFGGIRKTSSGRVDNLQKILNNDELAANFELVKLDITDANSVNRAISYGRPDLIFNEADQDHVAWANELPKLSLETTLLGAVNVLDGMRLFAPEAHLFQPLSSNIFGRTSEELLKEDTSRNPVSVYGIAKNAVGGICSLYREAYGLSITSGILFNHESERRTAKYLSRKVSIAVSRIFHGENFCLRVGDLDSRIDWGYAPEFMELAIQLCEKRVNRDIVIGTGQLTSVREFIASAFSSAGLSWEDHTGVDSRFLRKVPTSPLRADTQLLETILGKKPKISGTDIAKLMVKHDIDTFEHMRGYHFLDM